MPVLLIGWELGAGIGHLHRMVPIVDTYLAQGWTVTVAARHLAKAREIIASAFADRNERLSVVQAPIFLHRAPKFSQPLASLAHLFERIGFADPALCRPVIRAWRRLLDEVRPDLILSDFAPSLNVVAGPDVPILVIGNGWTIPPSGRLPGFGGRYHEGVDTAGQNVVHAFKTASGARWRGSDFCELLRSDTVFVCTLPQLDPYRHHRGAEYYWPVEIPVPAARHTHCEDVVVYLPGDHPALGMIEAAAARLPWRFHVYTGKDSAGSTGGFQRSEAPLDLAAMLPAARMAIHHGGLGMANWCLMHRVPQAVFPVDLEKLLVGRGVEHAEAGVVFGAGISADTLADELGKLADRTIPLRANEKMRTMSDAETLQALLHAADRVVPRKVEIA